MLARWRRLLLVLLIPAAAITQVFWFGPKPVNMAVSELILPLGIVLLLLRLVHARIRLPIAGVFWLAMLTILASSIVNADTALENRGLIGMVVELGKMLLLWLHFYLVVNLLDSRRDLLLLLRVWMASSAAIAASGIAGSLLYQNLGMETKFALMYRAQGTLNDSNLFASHCILSFVLTLFYRRLVPAAGRWTHALLVLYIAAVFFSASRGQLLSFAMVGMTLWTLTTTMRQKFTSIGFGVAALIVALLVPPTRSMLLHNPIVERLATTTMSLESDEVSDRRQLWEGALRGFASAPILGVGRGNNGFAPPIDPLSGQAHNSYLGLLCELGVLGFSAYVLLVGILAYRLFSTLGAGGHDRRATLTLLTALLGVGLSGITISIENYRGLWILLAIIEAYPRLAGTRRPGALVSLHAGRAREVRHAV
jgi:O-antigen ligase